MGQPAPVLLGAFLIVVAFAGAAYGGCFFLAHRFLVAVPGEKRARELLPYALAFTLFSWAFLIWAELELGPGRGQVMFQWAFTAERCRELLGGMTPGQRAWIGFSFGFDVVFMLAYPPLIALGCVYRSRGDPNAVFAVAAALASGFVDFLETIVFMLIVGNPAKFDGTLPPIGTFCAFSKYALLVSGIIYAVRGGRAHGAESGTVGTVKGSKQKAEATEGNATQAKRE